MRIASSITPSSRGEHLRAGWWRVDDDVHSKLKPFPLIMQLNAGKIARDAFKWIVRDAKFARCRIQLIQQIFFSNIFQRVFTFLLVFSGRAELSKITPRTTGGLIKYLKSIREKVSNRLDQSREINQTIKHVPCNSRSSKIF